MVFEVYLAKLYVWNDICYGSFFLRVASWTGKIRGSLGLEDLNDFDFYVLDDLFF